MVEDGVIYPLHEKLHEEDPRWPKDGHDTGVIEI